MTKIRYVKDPHLGSNISVLALNAAVHNVTDELNYFFNQGGNALHIHEEGGGIELRENVGRWLYDSHQNSNALFCCMIGHKSEDGNDRNDADSLEKDIAIHKSILKAAWLHLVYLDPPSDKAAICKIIETLSKNIRNRNIGSYGFRNWNANQIHTAINHADTFGLARPAAIITTEFSSAFPKTPLWDGYIAFDASLRQAAINFDLTVWAWIADINQPLFVPPNEKSWFLTKERMERWQTPQNEYIVSEFSKTSVNKGLTLRQANAEALLNQPFRVIGIISKDAVNLGNLNEYYDIARTGENNFL